MRGRAVAPRPCMRRGPNLYSTRAAAEAACIWYYITYGNRSVTIIIRVLWAKKVHAMTFPRDYSFALGGFQ